MHKQTDLVSLCTTLKTARKNSFDPAENALREVGLRLQACLLHSWLIGLVFVLPAPTRRPYLVTRYLASFFSLKDSDLGRRSQTTHLLAKLVAKLPSHDIDSHDEKRFVLTFLGKRTDLFEQRALHRSEWYSTQAVELLRTILFCTNRLWHQDGSDGDFC